MRALSKKRIYLILGVVLACWFAFRSAIELLHGGLSMFDAYALGGLGIAGLLIYIGLRMPEEK